MANYSNYGNVSLTSVDFINYKLLFIYDIKTMETLTANFEQGSAFFMVYSDFGKTQFIACNFSEVANFQFRSSKIIEIFIAGTKFPKKINTDSIQQQLGYGQLKKVYESRGDLIEARKYYAKEMIAYWNTIKWYSIGEHLLLFFNAISNGFTRYWLLGLGFTTIITYLFFYAYCTALNLEWVSIIDLCKGNDIPHEAGRIFVFFQPWHKPDEVFDPKISNTNWSLLWDFTGRIFIAFGIYQTIAAFRKHGRSGA